MTPDPQPVEMAAAAVETIVPARRTRERVDTGVPNLDLVLGSGLLRGTIVMVIGPPGSGKTILAQ